MCFSADSKSLGSQRETLSTTLPFVSCRGCLCFLPSAGGRPKKAADELEVARQLNQKTFRP
jgi:hypothetical protein